MCGRARVVSQSWLAHGRRETAGPQWANGLRGHGLLSAALTLLFVFWGRDCSAFLWKEGKSAVLYWGAGSCARTRCCGWMRRESPLRRGGKRPSPGRGVLYPPWLQQGRWEGASAACWGRAEFGDVALEGKQRHMRVSAEGEQGRGVRTPAQSPADEGLLWLPAARAAGDVPRLCLREKHRLYGVGRKGPVPPRPGCGGLLAAGRDWQVCRGWRQSCCPGGEIPASAFVPQSLLPLGKMWDRAVPSCSVCSHVFLLPLLLSPPLPSAARWSCSSSPAPAAAPRLPHVCYPFLSCPAVEASSARGPGVVFWFSRVCFMERSPGDHDVPHRAAAFHCQTSPQNCRSYTKHLYFYLFPPQPLEFACSFLCALPVFVPVEHTLLLSITL